MDYKIFNEDNLKDNEIDEIVVRVKAFIMNSKKEILMAHSNGGIQLIGGHVENDESYTNTLKREIKEETGMEVKEAEISDPFYEVIHYIKNYFNTNKNTICKIYYYIVKTDKLPNIKNINLTKEEKDYNFRLEFIPFENFEKCVGEYLKNEEHVNELIASETLTAFNKLKEIL